MTNHPRLSLVPRTGFSNAPVKRVLAVSIAIVTVVSAAAIASVLSAPLRAGLFRRAGRDTSAARKSIALTVGAVLISDPELNIARRAHTATRLSDG